ncbi:MAG: four helix bundle protein, partial [Victivallales bacterium]
MFNHEKLKVYQRTLHFNGKVNNWVGQWDGRHAVGDQLSRASCSMLENIAMASAAYSAMKGRSLDYAIGSTLECAACLDLVGIKKLLAEACVISEKEELSQILRMLVGLRRSWSTPAQVVSEGSEEYGTDKVCDINCAGEAEKHVFFHHEKLDVYRFAIETAKAFSSSDVVCRLL